MDIIRLIKKAFGKNESDKHAPVVIINKNNEVTEYENIETAIAELEKDPDIPDYKLETIRASIEELKSKGKIKIKNGEVIDEKII